MHFGEHITIDGYGGDYNLLNDGELVRKCFSELCELLGMHPLITPEVISAPDNQIKDPGGWSGYVIIAESHIAMHTFPKRGFISADVYTCQNGLETDKITAYFTNTFKFQDIETNFVIRGTHYPQENII